MFLVPTHARLTKPDSKQRSAEDFPRSTYPPPPTPGASCVENSSPRSAWSVGRRAATPLPHGVDELSSHSRWAQCTARVPTQCQEHWQSRAACVHAWSSTLSDGVQSGTPRTLFSSCRAPQKGLWYSTSSCCDLVRNRQPCIAHLAHSQRVNRRCARVLPQASSVRRSC